MIGSLIRLKENVKINVFFVKELSGKNEIAIYVRDLRSMMIVTIVGMYSKILFTMSNGAIYLKPVHNEWILHCCEKID